MIEIDPRKFYLIGIWCFAIIGLANLFTLGAVWSNLIIFEKISRIGGIVFNFALLGFFFYLYRQLPKSVDVATDEEMEEMLKVLGQPKDKKEKQEKREEEHQEKKNEEIKK